MRMLTAIAIIVLPSTIYGKRKPSLNHRPHLDINDMSKYVLFGGDGLERIEIRSSVQCRRVDGTHAREVIGDDELIN